MIPHQVTNAKPSEIVQRLVHQPQRLVRDLVWQRRFGLAAVDIAQVRGRVGDQVERALLPTRAKRDLQRVQVVRVEVVADQCEVEF